MNRFVSSLLPGAFAAALLATVGGAAPALASESFSVTVDSPASKSGAAGTAHVKVKPATGFHINQEFPTSLKLAAPAGLDVAHEKLTKKDEDVRLSEQELAFDVKYTAKQAGKQVINGTLS